MRSLIAGIANGSDSTRVLDGTVQTFTRVSKGTDGPVAIVEVDQPFALVEAQTGGLWSTLRLASAVGLAVSCCSSVSRSSHRTARHSRERTPNRQGSMSGRWPTRPRETKAERQQPGSPPTEKRATYAELFRARIRSPREDSTGASPKTGTPGDEAFVMDAEGQPSAEQPPAAEPMPAEPMPAKSMRRLEPIPAEPISAEPLPGSGW